MHQSNGTRWATTSARGRAVIEEWWRLGWDKGVLEAADELHAHDTLIHSPLGEARGAEPVKTMLGGLQSGTSSLAHGYRLVGSGHDFALVYWVKGVHSSTLYGVQATGEAIELRGTTSYRVEGGQIREFWQTVTTNSVAGATCLAGLAALSDTSSTRAWAVRWGLTPREASVADLVMKGQSDKEVAGELGLAPASVSKYVARTLAKAGVRSRSQLVESAGLLIIG